MSDNLILGCGYCVFMLRLAKPKFELGLRNPTPYVLDVHRFLESTFLDALLVCFVC